MNLRSNNLSLLSRFVWWLETCKTPSLNFHQCCAITNWQQNIKNTSMLEDHERQAVTWSKIITDEEEVISLESARQFYELLAIKITENQLINEAPTPSTVYCLLLYTNFLEYLCSQYRLYISCLISLLLPRRLSLPAPSRICPVFTKCTPRMEDSERSRRKDDHRAF